MSWLDPVRAALDAVVEPRPVFFRDDDAGWADDRLFALLDLFLPHEIAVDVAVIPSELTDTLARRLRQRALGGSARLHQHGYAHVNHEVSGRKYEFGHARGRSDWETDVIRGQALMTDALGDLVEPVFTPPWNRCQPGLGEILLRHGFDVLSCDVTATAQAATGLTEVPVRVDWFGHRKGVRWSRPELADRIATCVMAGGSVGVMLHHAITDETERAGIRDLLALVAAHPGARTTTIREVALRQGVCDVH